MKAIVSRSFLGIEQNKTHPRQWKKVRLKWLAEIIPSNVDKKTKEGEKKVYLCNYTDVYHNDFIETNLGFMAASASDSQIKKLQLRRGDVIATKDSEDPLDIGVPALVRRTFDDVVCGYHLTLLRSKGDRLDGAWLYWYIKSNLVEQYFSKRARGITRFALGTSTFKNIPVWLPPIEEQKVIANFLDQKTAQIDQTIADKEKLLVLYKEEKRAVIDHAVTKGIDPNVPLKESGVEWLEQIPEHWEVKKLNFLGQFFKGKGIPKKDLTETGVCAILYGDIYTRYQYFTKESQRFTSQEVVNQSFLLNYGDLLMTGSGETKEEIGKTIVFLGDKKTYVGGDVIVFRPKNINPIFLSYVLNHSEIDFLRAKLSKGEIVVHIYSSILKNIKVPLASLEEQQLLVEHIEHKMREIHKKEMDTQKEINLLKEYKEALIFGAVTGKIDLHENDGQ